MAIAIKSGPLRAAAASGAMFIALTACSSGSQSSGESAGRGDTMSADASSPGSSDGSSPSPADSGSTVPPGGDVCAAVAGFQALASTSSIVLSFDGAADASVAVSRKSYCGADAYETLATLPAGATTYTDSNVNAEWAYWYELTASDSHGHTASAVLATQAASPATPGCAGGVSPQSAGVDAGICVPASVDASVPPADGSIVSSTPITPVTADAQIVHPGDDIASIVQACSTNVVHFAAGTYSLTSTINIPANCQLEGELGWTSIITGGVNNPSSPIFQLNHSSNVTITRLNFQNVNSQAISNNNGSGSGNITNTHIYLNLFDHFGNNNPIWIWDPAGTLVERNAFNDIGGDGMHFYSSSPGGYTDYPSSNVVVRWNFGSNLSEVPGGGVGAGGGFIEIQIGSLGLHVYQNVIYSQKAWAGMALSIASGNEPCTPSNVCSKPDNGANGVFIDGNIVLDNGVPALTSVGEPWGAVEIMGTNPIVQNNFVRGWATDFFYDWIFSYDASANTYGSNGTIDFLNNTACGSFAGSANGMIDNPEASSAPVPTVITGDTFSSSCSSMAPPALYPQIVAAPEILDSAGGINAITNSVIAGPNTYWPNVDANLNSTFP